MAFVLRTGAANLPSEGDTVYVYAAETTSIIQLYELDGVTPISNPITVPDGQWGFEPIDEQLLDVYWDDESEYIVQGICCRNAFYSKFGGPSFAPDASGPIADRGDYDDEDEGFSYLATDENKVYYREGAAGNWSAGTSIALAIEIGTNSTHVIWRYVGAASWTNLVALADITGPAGSSSALEEAVVSMLAVGNIAIGQTLPEDMSFTNFVKAMLLTIFYPTFVAPTFSLSAAGSANQESGTTYSGGSLLRLTATFNRGLIKGDLVGGVWNATANQDYRAGAAVEYIFEGSSEGSTNYKDIETTIEDGANTYSVTIEHLIGPQPTDSDSNNYGTPYPADTVERTATIYGKRKAFFGVDSAGASSAQIRALGDSLLNPANGSSFTIDIPAGAVSVVFAYPATLQAVTEVEYVEGLGADVKSAFTLTAVDVEGANSYSAIAYKVYRFEPVEAFSADATYVVTI